MKKNAVSNFITIVFTAVSIFINNIIHRNTETPSVNVILFTPFWCRIWFNTCDLIRSSDQCHHKIHNTSITSTIIIFCHRQLLAHTAISKLCGTFPVHFLLPYPPLPKSPSPILWLCHFQAGAWISKSVSCFLYRSK